MAASRPTALPARRLALLAAVVLSLVAWSAAPTLAAEPRSFGAPRVVSTTPPVERTRTVDLSRSGTIVRQYTSYWCVPAATQTMLNLINHTTDTSRATQSRLYTELRRANRYHYATLGNDVRGWARVLTARVASGPGYADRSFTSRAAAYAAIVEAMDRTKRPVGIVVDHGTHAWTVVGFRVREVRGDPDARTVLGFYVVGPLGSPKDPWPRQYLTVDQLASRYTRYHESTRSVLWEGLYVIVAPVIRVGSAVASR
jgi:hypothetical protein